MNAIDKIITYIMNIACNLKIELCTESSYQPLNLGCFNNYY